MELQRVGHDWAIKQHHLIWLKKIFICLSHFSPLFKFVSCFSLAFKKYILPSSLCFLLAALPPVSRLTSYLPRCLSVSSFRLFSVFFAWTSYLPTFPTLYPLSTLSNKDALFPWFSLQEVSVYLQQIPLQRGGGQLGDVALRACLHPQLQRALDSEGTLKLRRNQVCTPIWFQTRHQHII